MAIDQTNVALDIAAKGVTNASKIQNALEEMEDLLAWGLDAGLSLANYDDDLAAAPELQHVDGATLNTLFGTVIPAVIAFLDAETTAGGDTYTEVIQRARRS